MKTEKVISNDMISSQRALAYLPLATIIQANDRQQLRKHDIHDGILLKLSFLKPSKIYATIYTNTYMVT